MDWDVVLCFSAIFLGGFIILGLVVRKPKLPPWSRSSKNYSPREVPEMVEKMGEDSRAFSVIYDGGHTGLDFKYAHLHGGTSLGVLGVTDNYVMFLQRPSKRRERLKFRIPISEIGTLIVEEADLYRENVLVQFSAPQARWGYIRFKTRQAEEIADEIRNRVDRHKKTLAEQALLEQRQIKRRKLDSLSPKRFEELVRDLFQEMGTPMKRIGGPNDMGVDLISKGGKTLVQCKRYKNKVGVGVIRDFYGAMVHFEAFTGYIVTTGEFTGPAREFAKSKSIELIDRFQLARLLDRYYS